MNSCQMKGKSEFWCLLPEKISGWKAVKNDLSYDQQTIFDYIDGAGEVYRSYNFRELLVRRYQKAGEPEIVVDFFVMPSSRDAFGVFTHDLEGEDAGVGKGSTYKGGLLSFWKGNFFVSVYVERETESSKQAVLDLGQTIASAIKKEGEKPELLTLLPAGIFNDKNIHYFHDHMILNYHFYLSDENILHLSRETEVVLASGEEAGEKFYLVLVKYPGSEEAHQAYRSFSEAYMPDASEQGLVRTEDGKWTAAANKGDYIAAVFGLHSRDYAQKLMSEILKKIE
ncbi:MAG: DUF6599 family protein [Candidatus Aminicenantales bacterium]